MSNINVAIKRAAEYPLPASSQTHEVVLIEPDLLLVSQQPSGTLVKIKIDPISGQPLEAVAHIIESPFSGLHGLTVSSQHPGCIWATAQFTSQLLLIDPVISDLNAPPEILKTIQLPLPARGPHVVIEDGNNLWASCKDSHHIVKVSPENSNYVEITPCPPRPIFVQVHPQSKAIYATLDQSSALFCIPAAAQEKQPYSIAIPPEYGNTPVGMVPGPDGNLWFALLGNSSGGNGSFGRILADGQIEWFQVNSGAAKNAGFIHLGLSGSSTGENYIFLLASSMASPTSLNAVVKLQLSADFKKIETQQTIAFPSQQSMSHRVLYTERGIYVTELGSCALVHLQAAQSPYGEGVNEIADPYSLWGNGIPQRSIRYS